MDASKSDRPTPPSLHRSHLTCDSVLSAWGAVGCPLQAMRHFLVASAKTDRRHADFLRHYQPQWHLRGGRTSGAAASHGTPLVAGGEGNATLAGARLYDELYAGVLTVCREVWPERQ